jgi:lipopolysaccharide/colanic/teichoic acid biosynthesis glycosyltransferase
VPEAFISIGSGDVESAQRSQELNGLAVRWVVEDYPRGTAGCLKQVEEHLRGMTIILISANLLYFTAEDLREMIKFHRESGADLTVGMNAIGHDRPNRERVLLGADGGIDSIVQILPSMDQRSNLRTSGMYIIESSVLDHVNSNGFVDMKEQLLPRLRSSGMKIVGWKHTGFNVDVRTMGDYLRVNFELLRNTELANGHLHGRYTEVTSNVWVGQNVSIDPSATLVRPLVIGDDSRVEEGATLVGPAVIGERCVLGKGSFVRESIFWPDSVVAPALEVERCLVSGKVNGSGNGRCREMLMLDGEPYLDGISTWTDSAVIRKVVRKRPLSLSGMDGRIYELFKRTFDIVFAALFMIPALPLFALIGLVVKLDSSGPAFFKQTRCGKDGKSFRMIKFRTMVKNAEELKETIRHLNQSDGPMFKIPNDPRETRFGRALRATNLDEIPQLINVLRGEMSLVGPRPLSTEEMRYNPHWRDARLTVRPGITGLWQIYGKDTNLFHDWIRYDIQYVDERSLWLDAKIIFVTLLKMLKLL